jgi:hypothetical protein
LDITTRYGPSDDGRRELYGSRLRCRFRDNETHRQFDGDAKRARTNDTDTGDAALSSSQESCTQPYRLVKLIRDIFPANIAFPNGTPPYPSVGSVPFPVGPPPAGVKAGSSDDARFCAGVRSTRHTAMGSECSDRSSQEKPVIS